MILADKIQLYRKKYGLTQRELAEKCDLATGTIQQYELNKRQPKIEQLRKIADALNVPVSVFIDELTEGQRIKSTWEWIQSNDEKRQALLIFWLETHGYKIEDNNIRSMTITDHQGFSNTVLKSDFEEMVLRSDKDIIYNIGKLLEN